LRYTARDPRFLDYLVRDNNYGVLPGYSDLCIIDIDNPERMKELGVLQRFEGKTFTVKTRNGFHFYFKCSGFKGKKVLYDPNLPRNDINAHIGEFFFSGNFYVAGPGCYHPSGFIYTVTNSIPVATYTKDEIKDILDIFGFEEEKPAVEKKPLRVIDWNKFKQPQRSLADEIGLRIENLLPFIREPAGDGEYKGAHPVHHSKTGRTFRSTSTRIVGSAGDATRKPMGVVVVAGHSNGLP